MKNSNLITIIICIIIAVIAFYFALYLYNDKMYKDIKDTFGEKNGNHPHNSSMKEPFYHFNPLSSPDGKYSEPSLSCQLARFTPMSHCTLTTGRAGHCDPISAECVEIPYIDLPVRDNFHLPPPIGEISPDCAYRNICARSDGEMGVCFSGYCYPSTENVH